MIAQPPTALRISPAVSDLPPDTVPRLAGGAAASVPSAAPRRSALSGLVQVFTCIHRNFFTQVMAQALRNAGQGTPTLIVQFLKGGCHQGPDRPMKFGKALDWVRLRLDHCINATPQTDGEVAAIREIWAFTQAAIAEGRYDAVVLDELSLAIAYGVISEVEVLQVLGDRPRHIEVTLTGQQMPPALLQMADQVTELRNVFKTHLQEQAPKEGTEAIAQEVTAVLPAEATPEATPAAPRSVGVQSASSSQKTSSSRKKSAESSSKTSAKNYNSNDDKNPTAQRALLRPGLARLEQISIPGLE